MSWQYQPPTELTDPAARVKHYREAMSSRERKLLQFGWQLISEREDCELEARLRSHFPILSDSQPPIPHIVWDVSAIYEKWETFENLEANLNLNALLALRKCTSPREEILAIDWQHSWYRFQPHAFPVTGDPYNWQVPILPDGDTYFFVPRDFRFGIIGIPHSTVCVYGAELLQAFAENLPLVFTKQIAWPREP